MSLNALFPNNHAYKVLISLGFIVSLNVDVSPNLFALQKLLNYSAYTGIHMNHHGYILELYPRTGHGK